jgi:phage head maturation protease
MLMKADLRFDRPEVNPVAEKIFQKVLDGTLRAASVGFLEVGKGKTVTEKDASGKVIGETYEFEGQELLEWSVVNIPSNPEASRRSLRNHTKAGVNFLRNTGLEVSVIRKLVNELLDELEAVDKPEEEKKGPDPNLNKYQEQLRKHKQ